MIKFAMIDSGLRDMKNAWKSSRDAWIQRALLSEEYYYNDVENTGTTYTAKQKSNIESKAQVPVSINFIHPSLNQKLALLTQTKTSLRVVASGQQGGLVADVIDKCLYSVLHNSKSQMQTEECIKDMLVTGLGHMMCVETDHYTDGMFNTSLKYLHYSQVILDPNSKDKSMDDQEGFWIEKEITLYKANVLYGALIEEINLKRQEEGQSNVSWQMFTNETFEYSLEERAKVEDSAWNYNKEKVRVSEFWEPVFSTMYLVKNDKGEVLRIFRENVEEELFETIVGQSFKQVAGIYWKKTLFFGDYMVAQYVKPYTRSPLATLFFEWGGKPYRSYGMIHFVKGMQEAYDSAIQNFLLNGILTNNAGWKAPVNGIPADQRKIWEEQGNNPMAIKEYQPIIVNNTVLVPERDTPAPLNAFYPTILEMLIRGMQVSTGITDVVTGDANGAGIDVFSTLQQYQSAAMQRVILSTQHISQAMESFGGCLVDSIVANIKPNSYYSFFDQTGDLNEIQVANDIQELHELKYLVLTTSADAMPSQKLAISSFLMQIAQSTPDPMERREYTRKGVQLAGVKEADDIIERMDTIKELQSQIQGLQQSLDRSSEIQKQLENRTINAELKARIAERMTDAESSIKEKTKEVQLELEIAKLQEEIKEMRKKDSMKNKT